MLTLEGLEIASSAFGLLAMTVKFQTAFFFMAHPALDDRCAKLRRPCCLKGAGAPAVPSRLVP
jgi:hypothetical protein